MTVVRFTAREEKKALPLLLRAAPGMVLPDRTYILSEQVVARLREEGIRFKEISRETPVAGVDGVVEGERW